MSTTKKLYAGEVRVTLGIFPFFMNIFKQVLSFFQNNWYIFYYFQKKKGVFHHSSFLAGGATIAAGRLAATHGILKVQYLISAAIFHLYTNRRKLPCTSNILVYSIWSLWHCIRSPFLHIVDTIDQLMTVLIASYPFSRKMVWTLMKLR